MTPPRSIATLKVDGEVFAVRIPSVPTTADLAKICKQLRSWAADPELPLDHYDACRLLKLVGAAMNDILE